MDAESTIELPEDFVDAVNKGRVSDEVLKEIARTVQERLKGVTPSSTHKVEGTALEVSEHRHRLGTHNLPNNTRVHKHGTFDYRFETRSVKWEVSVIFRHPTMSDFVNDAISCVGAAAVGSVVAAVVFESPPVGLALFKPAWKACMVAKVGAAIANDIQVELVRDKIHGSWTNH